MMTLRDPYKVSSHYGSEYVSNSKGEIEKQTVQGLATEFCASIQQTLMRAGLHHHLLAFTGSSILYFVQ